MAMEDRFIDAGGIRTHYFDEGRGPVLLLLHGGGAGTDAWANWRGAIPRLATEFRVLAIDMLGFGRTDKPDPAKFVYSQEARTNHVAAFIEALGLGKVNLIGNALGGFTALALAIARPELIEKLVLMGSAALRTERNEALHPVETYTPSRENMERLMTSMVSPGFRIDPELIDYRLKLTLDPEIMAANRATVKWIAGQGGLFIRNEDEITRVRHKTLILAGRNDRIQPPQNHWRLWHLIENSWLHLVADCGHWVMIERPDEFCALIRWFVRDA
jgi:2-hydroxy-6-oxo-6-(2'-aminophenyl)hexa-2,4-dienoate hydrolase